MDQIDEYEQGERVRTWLRNNGSSLIGGIAIGLGCLFGWQWWQGQQAQEKVVAAAEFAAFNKAVEAGQDDKAAAHATALQQNHPDTPYPALAALRSAELLHSQGKDEDALKAWNPSVANIWTRSWSNWPNCGPPGCCRAWAGTRTHSSAWTPLPIPSSPQWPRRSAAMPRWAWGTVTPPVPPMKSHWLRWTSVRPRERWSR
nr:tetratricopeptide repeat protein [Arenimonas daejeonensis]